MNKDNFSKFYQENAIGLFRYIYARVGNKDDSEDLTSTVFLKALKSIETYQEKGKEKAWLYRIAHNEIINFYRRNDRDEKINREMLIYFNDQYELFENHFDDFLDDFEKLTDEEKNLLYLRFSAELGFSDIARIFDVSVFAIRKRYYRLIDYLRMLLKHN